MYRKILKCMQNAHALFEAYTHENVQKDFKCTKNVKDI